MNVIIDVDKETLQWAAHKAVDLGISRKEFLSQCIVGTMKCELPISYNNRIIFNTPQEIENHFKPNIQIVPKKCTDGVSLGTLPVTTTSKEE